jgi:hypothetical protein
MTATRFLFGTEEDFGVAGYRTDSVESFILDAAQASVRDGRVPWPSPTIAEADTAFASLSSGEYRIRPTTGEYIGVAGFTHVGLHASDHFMHDNRMECGGYDRPSPRQMWNEAANGEGNAWKRLVGCGTRLSKTDPLREGFLRAITRLSGGCHNAPQFKPAAAAAVIKFFNAKSVLDPCAGWGDRLVAACACGVRYVGVDPNSSNFEGYSGIIRRYGKSGYAEVFEECFEDFDAGESRFDLAFTSPPYFDTERYSQGTPSESVQSWKKYPTVERWCDGFLKPFVARCFKAVRPGGIVAVNIKDTARTLGLCKRLNDECTAAGLDPVGIIAMEMKSAPGNIPSHRPPGGKAMIEPIFCFRKPLYGYCE